MASRSICIDMPELDLFSGEKHMKGVFFISNYALLT